VTRRLFTLIHKSIGRNLLRLADTTGATIVEFSISAALFFTMLFGVMVMSIAFYSYHYISEASREGARFAAVHGSTAGRTGLEHVAQRRLDDARLDRRDGAIPGRSRNLPGQDGR